MPPWRSTPREPRGPLSHDTDTDTDTDACADAEACARPGAPAPGRPFSRCDQLASERRSRQQELPQEDELLPQDEELLPQEDELLPEQEEEPLQEEPDDEPSQASPVTYQDDQLDEVSAPPPVAAAAPVPLLVSHVLDRCPLPRPYPDACRPRSSQARRQARRTSQAHSTAIPSTAAATTTKAVMIMSPFHRAVRTG
ncbi:hypothetical protein ACFYO0_09230 [Streptomyces sp. NPDC006365]|uniref:hypothetical protein n=1 Tax=Streptomyces sp. NPDC006365 TaxID=3364744 RepID=UPI003690BABA